ncbi:hypothetical protein QBC39DRAFT_355994 [Podospora conica]|nr:hypothetical protein QBC39DRAFT_355994 [Schizothecium conicum]
MCLLACLLACDVPTHARTLPPTTTYEMHRLGGPECVCACRLGGGVACCGMLPSIMALSETLTTRYLSPHGNPQRGLPKWPEWV